MWSTMNRGISAFGKRRISTNTRAIVKHTILHKPNFQVVPTRSNSCPNSSITKCIHTRMSSTSQAVRLHSAKVAPKEELVTSIQLRQLAVYSAIPMIGFGMIDNFIMIQAGDAIDNSLGVTFGLATLTSAAFGQIVSDFCGVTFGGTLEALVTRLGLTIPTLSAAQRQQHRVKLVKMSAAAVGVVLGCLIGMTSLFFKDMDAADRLKRRKELNTLFRTVVSSGHDVIGAERCSLYLVDDNRKELWTIINTNVEDVIRLPIDDNSIAGTVANNGKLVNIRDAYSDCRFNKTVDDKTGFRTNSILCSPVTTSNGKVVAVVQLINKSENDHGSGPDQQFGKREEDMLKMLCDHCGIFMRQIDGEVDNQ